MHIVFI